MPEDPRYLHGIALFNAQYFFDAHDAWEDLWADTRGEDRLFWQALIHSAVALYHWRNGNRKGSRNSYGMFVTKAGQYPAEHHGLKLGRFRDDMAAFFADLDAKPFDASRVPKMETDGLELPEAKPTEEM